MPAWICRILLLFFSHQVMSDFATPYTAAHQAPLCPTVSQSLLRFMSIESEGFDIYPKDNEELLNYLKLEQCVSLSFQKILFA